MDILKQRLAALALGIAVVTGASTSDAQATDPQLRVSRATANYECCIVGEQYAEHAWCNMEIYRVQTCTPRMPNEGR